MNVTRKLFIVSVLMYISAAAAYSQDCNNYLRRATELVSQNNYCDAITYYKMYSNCDADADVSTEIAMCERRCNISTPTPNTTAQDVITLKNGDEIQAIVQEISDVDVKYKRSDNPNGPDYSLKKSDIFMIKYANGSRDVFTDNAATSGMTERYTPTSTGSRMVQPEKSVRKNARFNLGVKPGLQIPTEKADKRYLFFGGGISGEYLPIPRIGIGISAGYYAYQLEQKVYGIIVKTTASIIPVTFSGKFYFLTENIQPYAGVDVGLFTLGAKVKSQGESASASESYVGLAPVIGLQFNISNMLALNVHAKYNLIFSEGKSTGFIGCNVGIIFTLGK